ATGYMHGDRGFYRFFAYLGLFMFSMLVLVMGSNFMMMFVGWEGVGLCSYLLIGYYFDRKEAGDASRKAFITNRVGDFGFALAGDDDCRVDRRRSDAGLRRDHRHHAERHQEGLGLLDRLAARLHVPRLRRRRVRHRHLPRDDPRLLQGPDVPRRGLRHTRDAP